MVLSRSLWAAWATTAAPSSPASCSDCFSKPPTSWWAASLPRWWSSRCSSSSWWRAPKASPVQPSNDAFDGYASNPIAPETPECARLREHIQRGAAFPGAAAYRHLAPTVRWRLLGRDRDPRLRLLGAGVRPQPGRRVWWPDRDRLGGTAHARSLHHQRSRGRQRHAGVAALSGAGDCGRGRRHLRLDHRPAGAEAADLLFRDHDAWLRHYRDPGGAGLAERDRGRSRRCRTDLPGTLRLPVGFLLFLLRPGGDLHMY